MKNPILEAFQDTLRIIKRHKHLVILIFLTQMLFFALIGISTVATLTPVVEATQNVLSYIQQLKLDEASFAENLVTNNPVFGENPELIYESYNLINKFGKIFLILAITIFIIFEGLNWAITTHILKRKKFNHFVKSMLNFLILTLIYFTILGFIITLTITKIAATPTIPKALVTFSVLVITLLLYFMNISFSLLYTQNIKAIFKKTLKIGLYKAYIIIPVMFINLILLATGTLLVVKAIESNLFLMMFALMFLISIFVFSRIFLVRLIHDLN